MIKLIFTVLTCVTSMSCIYDNIDREDHRGSVSRPGRNHGLEDIPGARGKDGGVRKGTL